MDVMGYTEKWRACTIGTDIKKFFVADPRKVGVFGIECWTPYKASQN
jgi:hypothetical protein